MKSLQPISGSGISTDLVSERRVDEPTGHMTNDSTHGASTRR